MRSFFIKLKKHKIKLIIAIVVGAGLYFYLQSDQPEEATANAVVVETVERGVVTSGIETTGEIVAAQKLDLDVYKQISRIEAVNVVNGGRVEAGTVIFSFDTSDAVVDVEASQVSVVEAELALETEQSNVNDPNTQIRTLENDIVELETKINQTERNKKQVYRTYLNANLAAESASQRTKDKVAPVISGLYAADVRGEYLVEVYSSNADSGYSYRVSGLESQVDEVIVGLSTDLGASGLEITFTNTVRSGDKWTVAVPNTYAPQYVQNREDYEEAITDFDLVIADARLDIANKTEEIENLLQTDSDAYRDLDVARAQAALAQAREQLSQNFDVVQEQSIVAPFSGTVEGMENVVVGASPTRDTNDPITLGTLISDDFLVTFSLSAVDVAKVEIGQLVQVDITSFPETPALEANIIEISSLPSSDGVAQYEVQALITLPEDLTIELREGLLADVEIVEDIAKNVLRVPTAAVAYSDRQAQVRVVDELSEEDQRSVERLGIIRTEADRQVGFLVDVELGVVGSFYSEVTSGLEEGQYLIVGDTAVESVLRETGPGGGRPRQGRPDND